MTDLVKLPPVNIAIKDKNGNSIRWDVDTLQFRGSFEQTTIQFYAVGNALCEASPFPTAI